MIDELQKIKKDFEGELAVVSDSDALDSIEIRFLGRKSGILTAILRGLKDLSDEEKRKVGAVANEVRIFIENKIADKRSVLEKGEKQEIIDPTVPGINQPMGHKHLVTIAINEIAEIFERLGFVRRRYPEVDWDWYAFDSLNMPTDHPARDEWETFFIDNEPVSKKGKRILTPHTSSGQVREMERKKPPIRMMNISTCYRRQIDVSHVPMFHQFEGLLIDKDVNIAHLKGTLDYFAKSFFGPERKIRIRPFHFQFTEPSFEVDISCGICEGSGKTESGDKCKMCKQGWLELGGAGMVHPNVLKAGKVDPNVYSGFAFGWGVERTYLMKAGLSIPDIRILYQNDLRFLQQF